MTSSMRPAKRSFRIRGHATSISLEPPFWRALQDAAEMRGLSPTALVEEIDAERGDANLSSAVRVWLLEFVGQRARRP